jgi:hypothetical protein
MKKHHWCLHVHEEERLLPAPSSYPIKANQLSSNQFINCFIDSTSERRNIIHWLMVRLLLVELVSLFKQHKYIAQAQTMMQSPGEKVKMFIRSLR